MSLSRSIFCQMFLIAFDFFSRDALPWGEFCLQTALSVCRPEYGQRCRQESLPSS